MFLTTVNKVRLGVLTALALMLLAGSTAQAQVGGVTMAKVTNNTQFTLSYQIKWGDGNWQSYSLRPGTALNHYYSSSVAPALYIVFDRGGNTGNITYTLPTWLVASVNNDGKPYQFLVTTQGYFDLASQ